MKIAVEKGEGRRVKGRSAGMPPRCVNANGIHAPAHSVIPAQAGINKPFALRPSLFSKKGFTLIEMVVVVAIVGILASAMFPLADMVAHRARESELRTALRTIREAIDTYKRASDEGKIAKSIEDSGYPKSLDDLVAGVPDVTKPDTPKIYILRKLPRDPMFPDSKVPAADTWGKRSYASPPDDPQEGQDVFDVYSLSEKNGLNNVPYREW